MDSCQAPDPGDGRLRMRVEAFLEDRSADTVTGPRRMGRTPLVEFVRATAEDVGLTVWSPGCEGCDVIILDHWSEIPGMEDVIRGNPDADVLFGQDLCHQVPAVVRHRL